MPFPKSPEGFVYFMQAVDGGPIKIGWAKEPEKRLVLIQCGNPRELRVCRTHPGTIHDEMALHRLFAEVRVRGEWFAAHPALARVADAIPDPAIEDSVLRPCLDLDYDTRQRMQMIEAEERATAELAPPDPLERRRLYEEHFPQHGGELPLTAIPDDMAPEEEWRQSSEAA